MRTMKISSRSLEEVQINEPVLLTEDVTYLQYPIAKQIVHRFLPF